MSDTATAEAGQVAAPSLPARRRRRVRPYIDRRPSPAQTPPPGVLDQVLAGLRALPARPPAPRTLSRRDAAHELAARLGPLAHQLVAARPEAWAPAEVNAPHPDVTATAPLEVVA